MLLPHVAGVGHDFRERVDGEAADDEYACAMLKVATNAPNVVSLDAEHTFLFGGIVSSSCLNHCSCSVPYSGRRCLHRRQHLKHRRHNAFRRHGV